MAGSDRRFGPEPERARKGQAEGKRKTNSGRERNQESVPQERVTGEKMQRIQVTKTLRHQDTTKKSLHHSNTETLKKELHVFAGLSKVSVQKL